MKSLIIILYTDPYIVYADKKFPVFPLSTDMIPMSFVLLLLSRVVVVVCIRRTTLVRSYA